MSESRGMILRGGAGATVFGALALLAFLLLPAATASGQIKFNNPSNFSVPQYSEDLSIGDFDNDTRNDVAVGGIGHVTVMHGSASGSFGSPIDVDGILVPDQSYNQPMQAVEAGNFDADSYLDLAAGYFSSGAGVHLSQAGASYGAPSLVGTGSFARTIATADFDGDTFADLAVGNLAAPNEPDLTIKVVLGNGDGTFSAPVNYPAGADQLAIEVDDFNLDLDPDLVVVNQTSNSVSVLLNDGDGTFTAAPDLTVADAPNSVDTGDLNGDTFPDLAVAGETQIAVRLGDGTGHFQSEPAINLEFPPRNLVMGKFDGDSSLDIAVAGFQQADQHLHVYAGAGDGSFGPSTDFALPGGSTAMAVGQLNGDSDPDLVLSTLIDGVPFLSVLLNRLHGPAAPALTDVEPDSPANTASVTLTGTAPAGTSVRIYANATCTGDPVATGSQADLASTGFSVLTSRNSTNHWSATSVNAIGVASDCSNDLSFVEDSIPPNTTVTSGPAPFSGTADSTPTFTFTSEPGTTFECRYAGPDPFEACTGTGTDTADPALGEGIHFFQVRAVDEAGNADPTPFEVPFTTDTVAPVSSIVVGPTGLTNNPRPVFLFSADESATFKCRFDAGAFGTCFGPNFHATVSALSDGDHFFEVKATDVVGNAETTAAKREFTVDTIAPETTIDTGPAGPVDDATPTFTFSTNDPAAFLACRFDAQAFLPCSGAGSHTPPAALGEGSHTFSVRSVDLAGNPDPTPTVRSFVVDTLPPVITIASGPAGTTKQTTAHFEFTANESGVDFACDLDGGGFQTCNSPKTFGPLGAGSHTVRVRGTDGLGHLSVSPATRTWTVDPDSPTSTVLGTVDPGGQVSTDPEGTGPTAADPATAAVTVPGGGTVQVVQEAATVPPPTGFSVVGQQFQITAPDATVAQPLVLSFRLDASAIPAGTDISLLTLLRNGAAAADCSGPAGTATPDPCIDSRQVLPDGDVVLTVLSSHASTWNIAVRPKAVRPAAKCVVPKLKGKKLAGAKKRIKKAHCTTGKVKRKQVKRTRAGKRMIGKVMSQSPAAGKKLKAGSKIRLVVGRSSRR